MNLSPVFRQRFFDVNGVPLAGGQLFTYQAGTTTPQTTYSNQSGTTNANPVVLDSGGYCDVWLDPTLAYKFVLEDSLNNVIWTVDNVSTLQGLTTWSVNTTYSLGSIVQDSSGQGIFYVSLVNNNIGNALTNVSAWRIYQGNKRTVSTNSTLSVTDDLVRSNSTSGNLNHTLPACATTPIGKEITTKDVGTGGNLTSLQGSGTDLIDGNNVCASTLSLNQSLTVKNNGTSWDIIGLPPGKSITQSNLVARSTGTTVAAGGVAVSGSSGTFLSSSTTYTSVTNLSVTITTTGRPVQLMLVPDGTSNASNINSSTVSSYVFVQISRGATPVGVFEFGGAAGIALPPSSIQMLDMPAAGTYTYTVAAKAGVGSDSFGFSYLALQAYEL